MGTAFGSLRRKVAYIMTVMTVLTVAGIGATSVGQANGAANIGAIGELSISEFATFVAQLCQNPSDDETLAVTAAFCGMDVGTVRVTTGAERSLEIPVLVAARAREQYAGYRSIGEAVIDRTAMLFLYTRDQRGAFEICGVRAPLDIAWARADGLIVDIQRMEPEPDRRVGPCFRSYAPRYPGPYRYALEVPAGFFGEHGIEAGRARLVVESGSATE